MSWAGRPWCISMSLTDRAVIAETVDEDLGRAVFELPEILQIVDGRKQLVTACWEMRSVGAEPNAKDLITSWSDTLAQHAGPRELPPCTHIGARSKTHCKRRAGHSPPHRYT